jgi:hypothetical protein
MCSPQIRLGFESPITIWLWTSELEVSLHARTSSVAASHWRIRNCRRPQTIIKTSTRLTSDGIKSDRAERWSDTDIELSSDGLGSDGVEWSCAEP